MSDLRVTVEIPEVVIAAYGWQPEEVPSKIREVLVMELLRWGRFLEEQAATCLHLTPSELRQIMQHYQVPVLYQG